MLLALGENLVLYYYGEIPVPWKQDTKMNPVNDVKAWEIQRRSHQVLKAMGDLIFLRLFQLFVDAFRTLPP